MSAESQFINAVLVYIGRRLGPCVQVRKIRLDVIGLDGIRQDIRLHTAALGSSVADEDPEQGSSIRSSIVEVLVNADGGLKGATIARRAGRAFSGAFRQALANMVKEGRLRLTEDGYELADDDEPTPEANGHGSRPGRKAAPSDEELAQRIAAAKAEKASLNGHHKPEEAKP